MMTVAGELHTGLLPILLPMNMFIAEYTLFCKLIKMRRIWWHISVIGATGILAIVWVMLGENMYYPFVIVGGGVFGVIEYEWIYKKTETLKKMNRYEVYLKILKIIFGVIVILLPNLRLIRQYLFWNLDVYNTGLSYVMYAIWGVEIVLLNSVILFKNRKMRT